MIQFGDLILVKKKLKQNAVQIGTIKLSIPKIQQEYLKIINNEDFQEINYLDNNDII